MFPPNQGSNLFQDSSLNRKPRENCYIVGYEGPNEILKDVPERAQPIISMLKISDPEDETVTCGSPYKFVLLNSPEMSHLGKPVMLERGHARLPQYKIADTKEQ